MMMLLSRSLPLLVVAWTLIISTHDGVAAHDGDRLLASAAADRTNPPIVRVFILVGQSNMEGKGSLEHLYSLLADNLTRSTYQHYVVQDDETTTTSIDSTDNTTFKVRDDVYLYFQDVNVRQGPLTIGFGDPPKETFGPELEFGWIVGDDRETHL